MRRAILAMALFGCPEPTEPPAPNTPTLRDTGDTPPDTDEPALDTDTDPVETAAPVDSAGPPCLPEDTGCITDLLFAPCDTGTCGPLADRLAFLQLQSERWKVCYVEGTSCTDDLGRELVVHTLSPPRAPQIEQHWYFEAATGDLVAIWSSTDRSGAGPSWYGERIEGCTAAPSELVGCDDTGDLCDTGWVGGPFHPWGAELGPLDTGTVDPPPTWPPERVFGEAIHTSPSTSIVGVGDLTGDGTGDLLLRDHEGILTVVAGGPGVLDDVLPSPAATVVVPWSHGHTVDGGDLNGDGIADLVQGDRDGSLNGQGSGTVYVFYGPLSGELDATDADLVLTGEAGQAFGGSVHVVGDLDDDGDAELAVRAVDPVSGTAALHLLAPEDLISGSVGTSGTIWTWAQPGGLLDVRTIGDLDGDGRADVLFGAFDGSSDPVWRYASGPASAGGDVLALPDGWTDLVEIVDVADVDGDGDDELLVQAMEPIQWPWASRPGRAELWVLDGPPQGLVPVASSRRARVEASRQEEEAWWGVFAPDRNLDGTADLLVLSPRAGRERSCALQPRDAVIPNLRTSLQGQVSWLASPMTGTLSLDGSGRRLWGETAVSWPTRLVRLGDVDGDGVDDVLVQSATSVWWSTSTAWFHVATAVP